MDELELALKIIKKRALLMPRPKDECHIFIQPHLLEWDYIMTNDDVLAIMKEGASELHIYDHEGRFYDFMGRIIEKDLRFQSIIVANMFYEDFEKFIRRNKYDLQNYRVGHLFLDKMNYAPIYFENQVLS